MAAIDTTPGTGSIAVPRTAATPASPSSAPREPRHLAAPGRRVRRDPQRDHDGRRDPAPHRRPRHHRAAGAVADDRVHADHGRGHPDHRLPAAPLHDAHDVRRRDEPVLARARSSRSSSPGFPMLLVARVVQASGTAIMMPLLMTTLMTVVPAAIRGRMMGRVSIVISLAPAIGPTLAGAILDNFEWRWIFGIVLPIALVALGVGARWIHNLGETDARADRRPVGDPVGPRLRRTRLRPQPDRRRRPWRWSGCRGRERRVDHHARRVADRGRRRARPVRLAPGAAAAQG